MTLALYLARMFLPRALGSLAVLAGLLQLVDLMDRSDEILERGLGAAGLARYAIYRLPLVVAPVIPIAALLGALFTFNALAGRSEIQAMRAAGLPVARLVAWLLAPALGLGLAQLVLADQFAPPADAALARWWEATAPPGGPPPGPLWLLDGADVVGIGLVAEAGNRLEGVTVYARDSAGRLLEVVQAARAERRAGGWEMVDGRVEPAEGEANAFATRPWPTRLTPENLAQLERPQAVLGLGRLRQVLAGSWVGAEPPSAYATRIIRFYALPLAAPLMILLATPVARGTRRGGGGLAGMALGLAAGLSYLVLDGILSALGEAATLPPPLAALAPPAIFASLGGWLLIEAEG